MPSPTNCIAVRLPDAPAICLTARELVCLTQDGEVEKIPLLVAASWLHDRAVMLCNSRLLTRRLDIPSLPAYDVLELFAFAHPAKPCVPTVAGLAIALGLPVPQSTGAQCLTIADAARHLLENIAENSDRSLGALAYGMGRGGWAWAPFVMEALGTVDGSIQQSDIRRAVAVWNNLPEWEERPPPSPPGQQPVPPHEARARLHEMVASAAEGNPEPRPQQADYASATCFAFTPRQIEGEPQLVLAEAGTGVGKTLGYLSAATLWAERNGAPVWISTYTRNLQRQIDRTLSRHYPDAATASRKVVVRKGRENYLCLLNYEEALGSTYAQPMIQPALGLMARWASATRDGDLTGDFPFWLADLVGRPRTLGLSDRRGECIYAACQHYSRCFIERSVRRAREADIVVANHALVMIQAANGAIDDSVRPTRYVFDEGHHIFDTADSAFSAALSGIEAYDLRRWLIGAEASSRSRARGLKRRMLDLIEDHPDLEGFVDRIIEAARSLPAEGWLIRVAEAEPLGPVEAFLSVIRTHIYARGTGGDNSYSVEADIHPATLELLQAAADARAALDRLIRPLVQLVNELKSWLDRSAADLPEDRRRKIEAVSRSLQQRGCNPAQAWASMLSIVGAETPSAFVDWFQIDRYEGRDLDVGFHRHWIDPTQPFADSMASHAHGLLVTSATLTDSTGDSEADWQAAENMSGAVHFPIRSTRAQVSSPFDYRAASRIYIVRGLKRNDIEQVSAAYRELFLASQGGGLGLFTSIQRLKAVRERIAVPLDNAGLDLYAQHVDGLNPTTLIDMFRAEEHSCLLGTDAIRDGVDVPGRSLRLLVFDRVPWSRPDILYKARRTAFGPEYEDRMTRLRLKQAFGRLIRRADDRGVFVLLDSMLPSRLCSAFPPEVQIVRTGLAEAVAGIREFLQASQKDEP